MILKFGKYTGEDIEDVPNWYLEWLLDNSVGGDGFCNKIDDELQDRDLHGIVIKD